MLYLRLLSMMIAIFTFLSSFADGFNVPKHLVHQYSASNMQMKLIRRTFLPKFETPFNTRALKMIQDSDSMDDVLSSPWDKPALAFLDFICIFIFAAVGKASHSSDGSLDISSVLMTAFPFLFAWYVTSPFTKIYGEEAEYGVVEAGKLAIKGWFVSIPLGICIRGVLKGYVPPLPFMIITLITTLILICGTRIAYSVVAQKTRNQ